MFTLQESHRMVRDQDGTSVTTTDCGSRFWKNSRKGKEGDTRRKTHPFREIPDCEQEQARSEGGSVKNVEVKASLPSADFGHKRAQTHYSNTLTIQCTDLDLSTNLNVDPKIDETRHVTHMSGTCHIYEWGMSRILMGHIAYMNETCYTWMGHVTYMDESCYTYEGACQRHEWGMLHIWMRHVTHMNGARHTHNWVLSHVWMSHVTQMNGSAAEAAVTHTNTHLHTHTHTHG